MTSASASTSPMTYLEGAAAIQLELIDAMCCWTLKYLRET